jgi:hypothetical protein
VNLIDSPILPGAPVFGGWAAPFAVHLLGLAIAATVALQLSRRWWGPFVSDFAGRPLHPGYSLWLTLAAFAAAYALEYVFVLLINVPLAKWLLDAMYREIRATDFLVMWLVHAARLLPYVLAAVLVPALSRPRREGPQAGGDAESWAAVRPAFLTILPWAVVVLLVLFFPRVSPAGFRSLGGLLTPTVSVFLMNLLFMPFFLGVLTPGLGRLVRAAAGRLRTGGDSESAGRRAGIRLVTLALGVAVTLAWALLLPRPGLTATGTAAAGLPVLTYVSYGAIYLIAAVIQDADRNVFWAPLSASVLMFGLAVIPALLGVFFQW